MSRDEILADERWEFDAEVARVFDDMLTRSIPQYQTMRALCDELVSYAIASYDHEASPLVVDVGSSSGGAIARLVPRFEHARFLGLEISEPMVEAASERFEETPNVEIMRWDLRNGLPAKLGVVPARAILCVLTLQFTPLERRQQILRALHYALSPGGMLILVEKVTGTAAETDDMLVDLYERNKRAAGYTEEQIARKRLALEGVLVPLTARFNEDMLKSAKFSRVECFWRYLNFAGWVAIQ